MAQEDKILRGYNCYSNDINPHDNSSSNPNMTFGANPLEFFHFESHNSVSHNSDLFWKSPNDHPSSSSSKPIITESIGAGDFYQFDQESCLQRHVLIPCEPNERPSQGLSLSLSSTNPSTIGIQSFELVRSPQEHHHQGYFGKSMSFHEEQSQDMGINQDGYFRKPGNFGGGGGGGYNIRSSRYLVPTQDLLNEFCNLGTKQVDYSPKAKAQRTIQDHENNDASSSKIKSLNSLQFLELQKRKTKLLQMLEEVDRRYKHYCDQMKAVVSSFEEVAGNGAAKVYSALASKAMSRHFRCLRDGIIGQIKTTKMAMGEKDISTPGMTRGETPRLRLLDQTLRQQRAFQQITMMDSQPWRPQRGLPERSVSVLRAWLFEHFLHPYPSDVDKHILARQTGLSRSQVSNWFINARVRLWKPMVEEMYMEETKEGQENPEEVASDHRFNSFIDQSNLIPQMDQKPTSDQLMQIDSECLSSIINHPEKMDHHHQGFARVVDSFGAMDMDFSSYHNHHQHNFGGGGASVGTGGGVSLTLGLQQHESDSGGGGVSVAFASTSQSNSLFYPRDHTEECQTGVQFSTLLEGDHGQNLPYRNLMGAQLLHDLAG